MSCSTEDIRKISAGGPFVREQMSLAAGLAQPGGDEAGEHTDRRLRHPMHAMDVQGVADLVRLRVRLRVRVRVRVRCCPFRRAALTT